MATQVDERIVSMKFDNKDFEKRSRETLISLQQLDAATSKMDGAEGLKGLAKAAKEVDLSHIDKQLSSVKVQFSALQVVAITTLQRITNAAITTSKNLGKALTIQPVTTGFNEYELKMGSIQTIMAGTGESIETVNKYLEELNKYSDKTIYSFSDMTQNIGKFTNAGVKLDKAVAAIKGISNVAALSGANANEASRAMYNFAQALSAGYVKLIDWKSIENANMATVGFKNQLLETATAMGTVTKTTDGMYKTLTGKIFNATKNFNEVFQEQWLTTDVLVQTLSEYASETSEIGKKAYAAAQDVKTFTMLLDTLKEAAQSGWAQSYELIFGNFEEAKTLWSNVNTVISEIIGKSADERNNILKEWKELGGRTELLGSLGSAWKTLASFITPVRDAIQDIFPPMTGKRLYEITKNFKDLVTSLKLSEESAYTLRVAVKTLLLPFKAIIEVAKLGVVVIAALFKAIWNFADYIVSLPSKIGSFSKLMKDLFGDERYLSMAESMNKIIDGVSNTFTNLTKSISGSFKALTGKGSSDTFTFLVKFKTVLNPLIGLLQDGLVLALNMISSFSFSGLVSNIKTLGTGIKDAFSAATKAISDFVKMIVSPMDTTGLEKAAIKASKVGSVITEDFDAAKTMNSLTKGTENLKDIFWQLSDALVDVVGNLSPYKIILLGLGVGIISMVFSMSNALEAITSAVKKIGNVFSGFSSIVTAVRRKLSIDRIIYTSTAILILAGALVAISTIPSEKLWATIGAMGALIVMMASLTAAVAFMDKKISAGKLDDVMKAFGLSMISASAGVLLLAQAMKILSSINVVELIKSFVALVAAMVSMIVALNIISGLEIRTPIAAASIVLIAGALGIIVSALAKLSSSDFSGIQKNIGALTLAIGALMMLAAAVRISGGFGHAAALLLVVLDYVALIGALRLLANMNAEKVYEGLLKILPVFGVLATIAVASRLAGGKHSGINILAMASSIFILAKAIETLGSIPVEIMTRGALIAGGLVLVLGITARIMAIGNDMKIGRAASQFIAVGVAIAALSLAIKYFGGMDEDSLIKGTVVVSSLIVLLGFLVRMTSYASKATLAVISLTGLLGILMVSLALLTAIPEEDLYPAAISLGVVLVSLGASLRLMSNMAKSITKSTPAVILIGLLLAALTVSLYKIKDLDGVKELIPVIASLTLVILAITALCNYIKPLKFLEYLPTVILMGLFVSAIGVSLASLNLINPEAIEKKALALSLVLTTLGVILKIISGFGPATDIDAANSSVGKLALLLIGATVALAALANFANPEGIIFKATALSEILIALGVTLKVINGFGSVNDITNSVAVIGEIAVLLIGATSALVVLSNLENPDKLIYKATALSVLLLGLGVSVNILGRFQGSIGMASQAILALGELILILGGVVAAFGALNKIPFFQEFITSGVDIFASVGTAIGLFIGNLAGGLITGLSTGWLTALAAELGVFATNFSSFINTIMAIEDAGFEKGSKVVSMITSFSSVKTNDAKELITFGKSLPEFANNLKKYFNTVSKVKDATIGSKVTDAISNLIEAFPDDMSKFKDTSLTQFGIALEAFGSGVVSYYNSIKDVTFDQAQIEASVTAGQSVATLANSLPGTGGWLQTILGDKNIGLFGIRLAGFGSGILSYWNTIKAAQIDNRVIDNVTESGKKIVKMLKDLPATGGWLQGVLGEKDYTGFVTNLPLIGGALMSFFNSITKSNKDVSGRVSMVNSTIIAEACKSLSVIINTLKDLPTTGGLLGDIFGNKDLSGFATGLSQLGTGVKDFAEAIGGSNTGNATSNSLKAINSFVDVLNQLQVAIDEAQTGTKEKIVSLIDIAYNTIREYRDKFFDSGQYIMEGFINGIKSKHALLEYEMRQMAQNAIEATNEELDENSPSEVFFKIGENVVLGFCNGIRGNQKIVDDRMVKMGEGAISSIQNELGINSPSTVARDEVGRYIVQGVAEGITADTSAEEAAARKAESIVNAFKDTFDRIKLMEESIDIDQQLYEAMNPDAYGDAALNQAMGTLQKRLALQADKVQAQEAAYKAVVQSGYATQEQIIEQENKWKQEQTKMYELSQELINAQQETQGSVSDRMVAYAQYISESKDDLLALGFTMEQIQKAAAERTGYMMESAAESAMIQFKTVKDVFDYYVKEADVIVKEPIIAAVTNGIGGGIAEGAQAVADSNAKNGKLMGDSLINGVTNAISNGDVSGVTDAIKQKFVGSGTYVWEGIVDGASSGLEKVSNIGSLLWDKVNNGFKDEGEIESPSKVMYQNGVWLVEGLVNGINASSPMAYDTMSNLASEVSNHYASIGTSIVNGVGYGVANNEIRVMEAIATFFRKTLSKINLNRPTFYYSGNNLTKLLCDGLVDGFTTYFDAVINTVTLALTNLEKEVKLKAESIAYSVSEALSQAAQIGVSGSMVPVVNAGENKGTNGSKNKNTASKASISTNNYTSSLANSTRQIMSKTTGRAAGASSRIIGTSSGTVVNNFVQNNTSPKALSRTEIYRDTKNLFSRAAGGNNNMGGGKK